MTGLEKILEHIAVDSKQRADTLLKETDDQVQELLRLAREDAKQKVEALKAKHEKDVISCLKRGESAALLQEKRMILQTKQLLIEETMEKAKASLYALSDAMYFETILKMVLKYAHDESGEIVFSPLDLERMPEAFEKTIASVLKENAKGNLKLSKETRAIKGGFVLLYGYIEENCSFDALFLTSREVLQDKVCQLLFEQNQ